MHTLRVSVSGTMDHHPEMGHGPSRVNQTGSHRWAANCPEFCSAPDEAEELLVKTNSPLDTTSRCDIWLSMETETRGGKARQWECRQM